MNAILRRAFPAALSLLALAPAVALAATVRHQVSVYSDDKEEPMRSPEGVACGDKGAIVVADSGNGRILTFTYRDGKLEGGTPVKVAEATYPVRVQIDGKGDVYVLDRKTRRIVRLDAAGKFAGLVEAKGASGSGAVAPGAFRVTPEGGVVLLDVTARRVLVLEPGGRVTRELPLPREGEEFTDVAVDGARILAVDGVGSRIWAADKDAKAFQPIGEAMKDRVSFPGYLAEDRGRHWLVDQNGHGLAVVGSDGGFQGRELEMGWIDGRVYYPAQVCTTPDGLLVVADRGNNRIQIFTGGR
ncbi:MAG TPA: NHL repeat-containing protein [Anaeromyxobacteraceae bacterium]|nr:NHL repeat-containing protein [Anaeromyxobacteraceae bacterium]